MTTPSSRRGISVFLSGSVVDRPATGSHPSSGPSSGPWSEPSPSPSPSLSLSLSLSPVLSPSPSPSPSLSPSLSPSPVLSPAVQGALVELGQVVLGALLLSLLLKTFLVQAFVIPSESMEPTLVPGDRVLASRLTPGPFDLHRGDVVVFQDPGGWLDPVPQDTGLLGPARGVLTFFGVLPQDAGEHLVKRVIGLPGDKVQCCDRQGRLMVNGVRIDEPYVCPGDAPSEDGFSVRVPAGHLWVMGDHRSDSLDSRYNQMQFVPVDRVVGRAFVTTWPLDRLGRIGRYDPVTASLGGSG